MLFIEKLVTKEILSELLDQVKRLSFEDGSRTAGWHAKQVKKNQQAALSAALRGLQRSITDHIKASPVLSASALPARIAPPLISRMEAGEQYGPHVDDAFMGEPPLRTDLSLTLFLSSPEDYDGGELVIDNPAGEEGVKLEAGSGVLYASGDLHRVEPVRAGTRLVAVTWIQSLVQDLAVREALFDMDQARRKIYKDQGKSPTFDLISKAHGNLLRRFGSG